jgi:hypothetical protein
MVEHTIYEYKILQLSGESSEEDEQILNTEALSGWRVKPGLPDSYEVDGSYCILMEREKE